MFGIIENLPPIFIAVVLPIFALVVTGTEIWWRSVKSGAGRWFLLLLPLPWFATILIFSASIHLPSPGKISGEWAFYTPMIVELAIAIFLVAISKGRRIWTALISLPHLILAIFGGLLAAMSVTGTYI
jgi:hypothetical protein